jgi:hypothetical protein
LKQGGKRQKIGHPLFLVHSEASGDSCKEKAPFVTPFPNNVTGAGNSESRSRFNLYLFSQERKTQKLVAMESHREEEAAKEAILTANMADNKKKLLTHIANAEAIREEEVKNLQQLKDKEREILFGSLAKGKR